MNRDRKEDNLTSIARSATHRAVMTGHQYLRAAAAAWRRVGKLRINFIGDDDEHHWRWQHEERRYLPWYAA